MSDKEKLEKALAFIREVTEKDTSDGSGIGRLNEVADKLETTLDWDYR